MNKYGWGTMMNDYTYLESIGRQVTEWGTEIGKMRRGSAWGRGRGRGRGRGHIRAQGKRTESLMGEDDSSSQSDNEDSVDEATLDHHGLDVAPNGLPAAWGHGLAPPHSKLEILQQQLQLRDIKLEVLPEGMEKRKANQSFWNAKSKTAMLTIEFVIHAPQRGIGMSSDPRDSAHRSFATLSHKNSLDQLLWDIVKRHLTTKHVSNTAPDWLSEVIPFDANSDELLILIARHPQKPPRTWYHQLDGSVPLGKLLRKKRFIEWPTIHIWPEDEFDGFIVGKTGDPIPASVIPSSGLKRVNSFPARNVLGALVGGYASGEESEGSPSTSSEKPQKMDVLLGYDSDSEENMARESHAEIEMADDAWADEDVDQEVAMDEELLSRVRYQGINAVVHS